MTLRAASHTDCKSLPELKMVNNNGQIAESKLKTPTTNASLKCSVLTQPQLQIRIQIYIYIFFFYREASALIRSGLHMSARRSLGSDWCQITGGNWQWFFFFCIFRFCCCSNRMMKNQFAGKMYWKIGIGISSTTASELLENKPSFFSFFPRVGRGIY